MEKVRKMETLKCIDELEIRDPFVQKYFEENKMPIEDMIFNGRKIDLQRGMQPRVRKWYGNEYLVSTLDEAGFIRHDLYPRTFNVWRLYHDVFGEKTIDIYKEYESLDTITDDEFNSVIDALGGLPEKESRAVVQYYGLEDSIEITTYDAAADALGISQTYVRILVGQALKKIRHKDLGRNFPPLFGWQGDDYRWVEYRTSSGAKFLALDPETKIDDIGLTTRTYNRMRRFETVGDLLDCPKDELIKTRLFGPDGIKEVEQKMREFGYVDFYINKTYEDIEVCITFRKRKPGS